MQLDLYAPGTKLVYKNIHTLTARSTGSNQIKPDYRHLRHARVTGNHILNPVNHPGRLPVDIVDLNLHGLETKQTDKTLVLCIYVREKEYSQIYIFLREI